jgi:predicted nucleic acid-binding protein
VWLSAEVVTPAPLPAPVCRDVDDDAVLALALTARVDYIVSGDRDLLDLKSFEHIPILTPAEAMQRIEGR